MMSPWIRSVYSWQNGADYDQLKHRINVCYLDYYSRINLSIDDSKSYVIV